MQAANRVLDILAPEVVGKECKGSSKAEEKDYSVLDKNDISGCDTWSPEEQAAAHTLL